MGVKGTFHEVGEFLAEVGSLPRIVTSTELKLGRKGTEIDRAGSPLVDASFRIVTYVLPEPPMVADTAMSHAST
jgi:Tfp pilus assembly protein PilO